MKLSINEKEIKTIEIKVPPVIDVPETWYQAIEQEAIAGPGLLSYYPMGAIVWAHRCFKLYRALEKYSFDPTEGWVPMGFDPSSTAKQALAELEKDIGEK